MNANIKVINPHLWVVKFSWLHWISDISLAPNPAFPIEQELARNTDNGILILNADYQHFDFAKAGFLKLQTFALQELKNSWNKLHALPRSEKTGFLLLVQAMIQLEIERREAQLKAEAANPKQGLIRRILKFLGFSKGGFK